MSLLGGKKPAKIQGARVVAKIVTPPVRWAEVRQFGVAMFAAGRRPGVEWGMPFAAGMGGAGYPQLHLAAVQDNVSQGASVHHQHTFCRQFSGGCWCLMSPVHVHRAATPMLSL